LKVYPSFEGLAGVGITAQYLTLYSASLTSQSLNVALYVVNDTVGDTVSHVEGMVNSIHGIVLCAAASHNHCHHDHVYHSSIVPFNVILAQ
jgi:hypothetical protein